MNRFRFRNLERFRTGGTDDEMRLTLPLPRTPDGKVMRSCPSEGCMPGVFQLGDAADPRPETTAHRRVRPPGTPGTTCPYCGGSGADNDFTSEEDIQAALSEVKWAVGKDVSDFMSGMASNFNRKQSRNSLINISMEVKGHNTPRPRAYREDLLRDLGCDACGCRYGVYAIGLFCPDCAAPNLLTHFMREVELITEQIDLAETARTDGRGELAFRLLGNAHEDVLTSFETYLKTAHRYFCVVNGVEVETKKSNRFQSIHRTREAFTQFAIDPFAALPENDLAFLRLNIEKRHVVGHNLGLVDEHFAEAADEGKPGQTVTLLAHEVKRFADICRTVIAGIDERLPPASVYNADEDSESASEE